MIDPDRKDLYVEGRRDRLFLNWLMGNERGDNCKIFEISTVDIPNCSVGGERARLFAFAELVGHDINGIRCFADADAGGVLNRTPPANVWLTDRRDLEGYVLEEYCLTKVIRLSLNNEEVDPVSILCQVLSNGRCLGLLRILSELDGLSLPFRKTDLAKHLKASKIVCSLDLRSYLQSLLQNCGESLTRIDSLIERLDEVAVEFQDIEDNQIVHGKDAMTIIEKLLSQLGMKQGDGPKLLWSSFDRTSVSMFPNLLQVCQFLTV
jgi:hypothetical protein